MEPILFQLENDLFFTGNLRSWEPKLTATEAKAATEALELGQIIYFPNLSFELTTAEKKLLEAHLIPRGQKNISYDAKAKKISGLENQHYQDTIVEMMHRYHDYSCQLLNALCPNYESKRYSGRTSYRPVEIKGRKSSYRKDDTRLHVDAFPSTPVNNLRILRVFSNINPHGQARFWNLGEPFQNVMQRFLPNVRAPMPFEAEILFRLKITKKKRQPYDHYMLKVHNSMKKDMNYQKNISATAMKFPPGSTWVVYTDLVSHAALEGKFVLEQTYYPPVEKMQNPTLSPQMQMLKCFKSVHP